jgi:DNA-binding HxlR family transcriptional regulator
MEKRSPCPIACVLDLIGDRWTLLVVRDLVLGKQYFDEFAASPEGIATNILSARLKFLEEQGFASSERDPADGRRVRYQLTAQGRSLRGLLAGIAKWGLKNIPGTDIPSQKNRINYRPIPSTKLDSV